MKFNRILKFCLCSVALAFLAFGLHGCAAKAKQLRQLQAQAAQQRAYQQPPESPTESDTGRSESNEEETKSEPQDIGNRAALVDRTEDPCTMAASEELKKLEKATEESQPERARAARLIWLLQNVGSLEGSHLDYLPGRLEERPLRTTRDSVLEVALCQFESTRSRENAALMHRRILSLTYRLRTPAWTDTVRPLRPLVKAGNPRLMDALAILYNLSPSASQCQKRRAVKGVLLVAQRQGVNAVKVERKLRDVVEQTHHSEDLLARFFSPIEGRLSFNPEGPSDFSTAMAVRLLRDEQLMSDRNLTMKLYPEDSQAVKEFRRVTQSKLETEMAPWRLRHAEKIRKVKSRLDGGCL